MSGFNANAVEWTPNVNAAAWTPGGGTTTTTTTNDAPPAVVKEEEKPVQKEEEESKPAPKSEEDALLEELSELLASGEISKKDYDDAVAEMKGEIPEGSTMTEEDKIVAAKGNDTTTIANEETETAVEKTDKKTSDSNNNNNNNNSASDKKKTKVKIPVTDAPDPDPRNHINVVFIGHVDAGKSTISGQILYLTGQVDQRTIEKFEKEAKERNRESWFMAYIMDTNEEERAKGKTVEVGMAHFASEKKRFTILDAPGHKNYVPNMIGGAAQADIGVLVISARKGEFEAGFEQGGQTREHAMLAYTLGVQKLIILVNKMDCCDWEEKRYTQIKKKLAPFLRSCGYKVKRDCVWICASGLHGLNLSKPLDKTMAPWMKDRRCLLDVMDDIDLAFRDPDGPVRVPILEKFSDRGTWIMGKVEQGTVRIGQKYIIMPNGTETKVADLTIKEETVAFAKPGENVRIKLANTGEDMVAKGFVLSAIDQPIPVVRRFRGILQVIELLEHRPIISPGYKCILHVHTATEECQIAKLLSGVDRKTGKPDGKRCQFLKTGTLAYVEIRLKRSISLHTFEQMKQLGRFTLRDEQLSIAIGKITALAERTVKS